MTTMARVLQNIPLSDAGPVPGQVWPQGYDAESGEAFKRMLADTAISAADPMQIPSAMVGMLSPAARDAWRARQKQSEMLPHAVGQLATGGGMAALLRSLPALAAGGAVMGGGSDVLDRAAGVPDAANMSTLLKAGMGALGMGATSLPKKALAGIATGGGALVGADVARGGSVPGSGERIDIPSTEKRITEIKGRIRT